MSMIDKSHITAHAVRRYRERVRDVPVLAARDEMMLCIAAANPRHFRKLSKKTAYIPTGCCLFVWDRGAAKIVTVLERPDVTASHAAGTSPAAAPQSQARANPPTRSAGTGAARGRARLR